MYKHWSLFDLEWNNVISKYTVCLCPRIFLACTWSFSRWTTSIWGQRQILWNWIYTWHWSHKRLSIPATGYISEWCAYAFLLSWPVLWCRNPEFKISSLIKGQATWIFLRANNYSGTTSFPATTDVRTVSFSWRETQHAYLHLNSSPFSSTYIIASNQPRPPLIKKCVKPS